MKRTPIDPADIRVGDLVERRCTYPDGVTHTRVRGVVAEIDAEPFRIRIADMWSGRAMVGASITWYLLDRPDPLAEVVEVAAKTQWTTDNRFHEWADATADQSEAYRVDARAVVAAISERWELVERGQS